MDVVGGEGVAVAEWVRENQWIINSSLSNDHVLRPPKSEVLKSFVNNVLIKADNVTVWLETNGS